jgi:hypothetical protein
MNGTDHRQIEFATEHDGCKAVRHDGMGVDEVHPLLADDLRNRVATAKEVKKTKAREEPAPRQQQDPGALD